MITFTRRNQLLLSVFSVSEYSTIAPQSSIYTINEHEQLQFNNLGNFFFLFIKFREALCYPLLESNDMLILLGEKQERITGFELSTSKMPLILGNLLVKIIVRSKTFAIRKSGK